MTNFSASLRSSPANTATVVVPSPTSSSWVLEISIKILAAGLSTKMDCKIVAPSFVTVILSLLACSPSDYKILSIPFGPRVVLTKSATAIAPTKDCYIRKIKWIKINLKKIYKFEILAPKLDEAFYLNLFYFKWSVSILTSLASSPLSSVAPVSKICGRTF